VAYCLAEKKCYLVQLCLFFPAAAFRFSSNDILFDFGIVFYFDEIARPY
jgi:hypothetical protein